MDKKIFLMLEIPPSINACYVNTRTYGRRGRMLTETARNWKLVAAYAAKSAVTRAGWTLPAKDQKIILEVTAFWPDKRRHDMNNSHKLLCDALEGVVYPDDCMVLVRDMDFSVDRKNPRLEVYVYLKED